MKNRIRWTYALIAASAVGAYGCGSSNDAGSGVPAGDDGGLDAGRGADGGDSGRDASHGDAGASNDAAADQATNDATDAGATDDGATADGATDGGTADGAPSDGGPGGDGALPEASGDAAPVEASADASGGDGAVADTGATDSTTGDGAVADTGATDATTGDGAVDARAADAATDAASGDGAVPCAAVSSGIYYVDPINGSDGTGSTGSDSAGGVTSASCAFKTVTHALGVVGPSRTSSATIIVLGPATVSAGEVFPLVVPTNVVVKGQGGAVTVSVPATTTTDAGAAAATGFVLAQAASGLESLTINGQSLGGAAGIRVTSGSTDSTYVKNVTVENFTAGAGILVAGTGVLTLDEGTRVQGSLHGLHVTASGKAASANTNESSPVIFSANTQEGVLVDQSGSVVFTASAGTMGAGSIVASGNTTGFAVRQDGPSLSMPMNTLSGVVAWKNTAEGVHFEGGSNAKLRGSYVGANAIGVMIGPSTTMSYDTSHLDLGTSATADPGRNTLQSVPPSDGGTSAQNTAAGVCFSIPASNSSEVLYAYGNVWVDAAGTAPIDCTGASPGALSTSVACIGGVDVAGQNVRTMNTNIGTSSCTH